MAPRRISDWAFFGYFLIQIPTTLLFDTQGVYSEWLYPGFAKSLRSMYLTTYRDPFLADAWQYPWYLSICLVEHFIEFPFFIWAAYIYYTYGAQNYTNVVLPSIMYGVHTATSILGVWAMALGSDFSQSDSDVLTPRTFGERIHLCSAYGLFFGMSVWMVVDNTLLFTKLKREYTRR